MEFSKWVLSIMHPIFSSNIRAISMLVSLVWLINSGRLPVTDTWAYLWVVMAIVFLIKVPSKKIAEGRHEAADFNEK